ncbi:zinc ribbon domain-containing protein [Sulfurisphaera javensis]|uniref:Zinc ribbon domain-containing protein n=1 Tax=Sulfurisphaera javensis TaxID=2049879 RepID=A0AAT9GSE7_9CREN
MQKTYTGRYVNIPLLAQEINNLFLSEGWESQTMQLSTPMMQPGMPQYYDYEIRAMKKGHLHHVEEVIVRIRGYPNEFSIIVEEEHIGPLGRDLINHRLIGTIDKQISDGMYDMPMPMQQSMQQMMPQQTPSPQMSMPQMQQGIKCPQCGYLNPPGAKFCLNCGTKLF